MKRKLALLTCLAVLGLGTARVLACNVPVFRYALERWEPDLYQITVPATPTNLVAALREARLNLEVITEPVTNATVLFPELNRPLWAGAFTADNLRALVDSPARRAIVRHIQQGASAVWVVLGQTALPLETELARLAKELRLPEVDPDDPRTAGNVHLKIAFPVVRVAPDDPAERLFVAMLSGTETNLPAAVPVFGRGRALARLAGKDLTLANITAAAEFLCGACSCEVKAQNPGWDLLIAADWDAIIDNPVVKDPELPPLISLSALAAAAQPAPAPVPAAAAPRATLMRNLLLALVFVVVAVVAGTVLVRRKP